MGIVNSKINVPKGQNLCTKCSSKVEHVTLLLIICPLIKPVASG